jgi:hypothetical protein
MKNSSGSQKRNPGRSLIYSESAILSQPEAEPADMEGRLSVTVAYQVRQRAVVAVGTLLKDDPADARRLVPDVPPSTGRAAIGMYRIPCCLAPLTRTTTGDVGAWISALALASTTTDGSFTAHCCFALRALEIKLALGTRATCEPRRESSPDQTLQAWGAVERRVTI